MGERHGSIARPGWVTQGAASTATRVAVMLASSTIAFALVAPAGPVSAQRSPEVVGSTTAAAPLGMARHGQTSTTLGIRSDGVAHVASVELFDPTASTPSRPRRDRAEPAGDDTGVIPSGSLKTPRYGHTSTTLADGRVLVVGGASDKDKRGRPSQVRATAEVWDPARERFRPAGTLEAGTIWHTATLLADDRVLIAGGYDGRKATAATEVWDPATGTFAMSGPLSTARHGHGATLLPDGRVLIVGGASGRDGDGPIATAEIWDPVTGVATATGSMSQARWRPGMTLLPDGTVLIVGGSGGPGGQVGEGTTAEIWDAASGTFRDAGSLAVDPEGVTATALADGRVLIVGKGEPSPSDPDEPFANSSWTDTAILFDPVTGTSDATGGASYGRTWHTATLLPDGRVLIAAGNGHSQGGGFQDTVYLQSIEIYDPVAGTFSEVNLGTPRTQHAASLLQDGRVLLTGGYEWVMDLGQGPALRSSEVWRQLPPA